MSDTRSHDVNHAEKAPPIGVSVLTWLCGGLGLYLGVFVLLLLDELVLGTRFFMQWFPNLIHPARIFYFPLLWIMFRLGLLPAQPPIF